MTGIPVPRGYNMEQYRYTNSNSGNTSQQQQQQSSKVEHHRHQQQQQQQQQFPPSTNNYYYTSTQSLIGPGGSVVVVSPIVVNDDDNNNNNNNNNSYVSNKYHSSSSKNDVLPYNMNSSSYDYVNTSVDSGVGTKSCFVLPKKHNNGGTTTSTGGSGSNNNNNNKFKRGGTSISSKSSNRSSIGGKSSSQYSNSNQQQQQHSTSTSSTNAINKNRFLLRNTFRRNHNNNNNNSELDHNNNSKSNDTNRNRRSTTGATATANATTSTSTTQSSQNSSSNYNTTSPRRMRGSIPIATNQQQQQQYLFPQNSGSEDGDIYNRKNYSNSNSSSHGDASWLLKGVSNDHQYHQKHNYSAQQPWGGDVTTTTTASPENQFRKTNHSDTRYPYNYQNTNSATIVTPDTKNEKSNIDHPNNNIVHLLTLPPIEDRGSGNKKRMQYEQQKLKKHQQRQRGLYEGEIEPIGSRGQEARVVPSSSSSSRHLNNTNQFVPTGMSSSSSSSFGNLQIIKPVSVTESLSNQPQHQQQQVRNHKVLVDIPEESHDSSSISITTSTAAATAASKDMATTPAPTTTTTIPSTLDKSNNNKYHQFQTPQLLPTQQQQQQQQLYRNTVDKINQLHPNRPSRLIPPPPSRVKRLLLLPNNSDQSVLPGTTTATTTTTTTPGILDSPDKINKIAPVNTTTTNNKELRRESSRAVGDIPWDRASLSQSTPPQPIPQEQQQPKISNVTSSANQKALHRESSRAVGDIPWERTSQPQIPIEQQQPDHPGRVISTVDSEFSSESGTLQQQQQRQQKQIAPIDNEVAAINEMKVDNSNVNVESLHAIASNAVRIGNYDVALKCFHTILQIQLERYGRNHAVTAAAYHNLGTVYAKQATSENADNNDDIQQRQSRIAALECFQAAARCARDASPDIDHPHPNVAVSLVRVGFLLLQSKQYQNAIVTFQEALRIRITHYGKLHALSANLYNNLGVCCLHLGEFEQGLYHLEQALEIQRHLVAKSGRGSPKHQGNESAVAAHQLELADTLFNIGGLCLEWMRRQGPDARRADEAEAAFLECLQLRTRVLGQARPQTLQVKSLYGIAKSVPRPRRILKATPSPDIQQPDSPIMRRSEENVVEPPHIRRLNQRSRSPIKIPSMSPIGPLSEVSSIVNEDSMEATSIFRVGGSNNTSPQRRDVSQLPSEREPHTRKTSNNVSDRRSSSRNVIERQPPVLQITISREEDEPDDFVTKGARDVASNGTHIYMTPHLVPESPNRRPILNDSGEAQANQISFEKDQFTVDTSVDIPTNVSSNSIRLTRATSYDTEENCIISESGVDSDIGRVHYPLAWNRAGILQPTDSTTQGNLSRRDIKVVQPMRHLRNQSCRGGKHGAFGDRDSTGNAERDEIMARARAILTAHDPSNLKTMSEDLEEQNAKAVVDPTVNGLNHHDLDDGVASLGGNWNVINKPKVKVSIREMLQSPMTYLPEIHEEASKQLSSGNTVDAYRLFDVVLQCQRHLQGPLHPDVAAALHNIGIVQLRAQNPTEALKAFEEAARVRKGSLGKDHPLVAISLVKVGISLLLMHRFDDALWSFREALAVRQRALGPLHPSTARIYNNIGCVYVEFNEYKEARRAFEAALDVQRNALCNDAENGPLMFGTATTLCNLGYLYRYRDMHGMAAAVLQEAAELQEKVLGPGHATVLSTLDNLADSCANSGNSVDALKYYHVVLNRFRTNRASQNREQSSKLFRAEAVLLYKMSRVYRKQNNRDEQLNILKAALQAIRQHSASRNGEPDTLERRIHYDIRALRESNEKDELKWI